MGPICRAMFAGGLLLPFAVALLPAAQAAGDRAAAGKTVKDCNAELQKNQDALDAAGESAATFFHTCWHSEKGKPTPIAGAKTQPADVSAKPVDAKPVDAKTADTKAADANAADTKSSDTKSAEAHVAKGGDEGASRRRQRHVEHRRRNERRYAYSRARMHERFYAREPREPSVYSEAVGPTVLPPQFPPRQMLPSQVNVNIPMVGSISAPILPLPGLAATVRDVVANPVVPGLVTATP